MASYITVVNGAEVKTPKTKGRTKLGWVKGADGDYRLDSAFDLNVHKAANRKPRTVHFYVTLNTDGSEASRVAMGKGRPNKEFTKNATDGNFYKTLTPVATPAAAAPAAVEAAPATVPADAVADPATKAVA